MTSSPQLVFLVTARHHNVPVVVERATSQAEADALAERMAQVDGTTVTIEEVREPGITSVGARLRERSDAIGWRDGDRTRRVGHD